MNRFFLLAFALYLPACAETKPLSLYDQNTERNADGATEVAGGKLECEETGKGTLLPTVNCIASFASGNLFKGSYKEQLEVGYEDGSKSSIKIVFQKSLMSKNDIITFPSSSLKSAKVTSIKVTGISNNGEILFVGNEIVIRNEIGGPSATGGGTEQGSSTTNTTPCSGYNDCGFGLK